MECCFATLIELSEASIPVTLAPNLLKRSDIIPPPHPISKHSRPSKNLVSVFSLLTIRFALFLINSILAFDIL